MEDKLNMTIHNMKMEREELELKKDQEISSLKRFTEKLQRDKDDSTLRFEEEKHRSMMLGKGRWGGSQGGVRLILLECKEDSWRFYFIFCKNNKAVRMAVIVMMSDRNHLYLGQ